MYTYLYLYKIFNSALDTRIKLVLQINIKTHRYIKPTIKIIYVRRSWFSAQNLHFIACRFCLRVFSVCWTRRADKLH